MVSSLKRHNSIPVCIPFSWKRKSFPVGSGLTSSLSKSYIIEFKVKPRATILFLPGAFTDLLHLQRLRVHTHSLSLSSVTAVENSTYRITTRYMSLRTINFPSLYSPVLRVMKSYVVADF
jgi:hypothetical protein